MKKGIPTTTINNLAGRICRRLPERRKKTLSDMVMKRIVDDSDEKLRAAKRSNTRIWRENIGILRGNIVEVEFKRKLRQERKRQKLRLRQRKRKKIRFLSLKYQPKQQEIPDEADGIIFKEQPVPDNF